MNKLLGNLSFPSGAAIKSFLIWDFLRTFERGWNELSNALGLLSIAGVIVTVNTVLDGAYVQLLTPGICSVILLYPFLKAGYSFVESNQIPKFWRNVPFPIYWFALKGVVPRFLFNMLGLFLMLILFEWAGIGTSFIASPLYWGVYISVIPGAVGWGLIINGVSSLTRSSDSLIWGIQRFFELSGAVFVSSQSLSSVLYSIHFLIPYSYLSEYGRLEISSTTHGFGYYAFGGIMSAVMLVIGILVFHRIVLYRIRSGAFDRTS